MHISESNAKATWLQITNQNATGQTAADGFRLGFRNGSTSAGYLRWQENKPFIIQTDWNNGAGGINAGERMRITSIGSPNVPAPANPLNNNITRVAISHRGNQPITRPRSLLHLGYNTGTLIPTDDGWRNWMDVGTFTAQGSDNMYIGLKDEGADRFDAIINWGDNQVPGSSPNGPDYLRFIFTSTNTALPPGQGDSVSQSNGGLEIARMHPGIASTLTNNYGMMGIGNYTITGPNAANPIDAKLDIDGDLRIRTVTQDNALTQVLVIDPNDLNRVHWKDITIPSGGGVTANNGASIDPANPNNVQWGQKCSTPGNPGQLLSIREIPMNGNDVYFTGQSNPYTSTFSIGIPCGTTVLSKFGVLEAAPTAVGVNTIAGGFKNIDKSDGTNNLTGIYSGISSESTGIQPITLATNVYNIGGDFIAKNGNFNIAVRGRCVTMAQYDQASYGGNFESAGPSNVNYGVYAKATGGNFNYGIFAESPTSGGTIGPNYAGFFAGDVVKTGQDNFASDLNLKQNIQAINSSLDIVQSLQPKEFEYQTSNFPYMGLSSGLQSGLIAQEVELIIPHLVKDVTFPERFDTLGNQINAALTYKTLNYVGIIPYLIGAIQEQQSQIDSITTLNQDSIITALDVQVSNLEARLSAIEECLENTGICSSDNQSINENNSTNASKSAIDVELNDAQNIVLEQNVPNPFAERTTINYSIPNNIQKAQIHFYNQNGQLINTVEIEERGEGQLNVYANDLSTGVYTYTLVVDGQISASKRMVRTK